MEIKFTKILAKTYFSVFFCTLKVSLDVVKILKGILNQLVIYLVGFHDLFRVFYSTEVNFIFEYHKNSAFELILNLH